MFAVHRAVRRTGRARRAERTSLYWTGYWHACVAILASLLVAGYPVKSRAACEVVSTRHPAAHEGPERPQESPFFSDGAWGRLTYHYIYLAPPPHIVQPSRYLHENTMWFFREWRIDDVRRILAEAGLERQRLDDLMRSAVLSRDQWGFRLSPSTQLIESLEPGSRTKIYTYLAQWPQNEAQNNPLRLHPAHWEKLDGISEETKNRVIDLSYQKDHKLYFSDTKVLLMATADAEERSKAIQALTHVATIKAVLLLNSSTDVERLAEYWGKRGREEEVREIIEQARADNRESVDICRLLPPFARERVFKFQSREDEGFRDCHWTSMNFFNAVPEERFAEGKDVQKTLATDYLPVEGEKRLGDIILLADENNRVLHSCNYIADDIVFTKNGGSQSVPWVLMKLEEVVERYAVDDDTKYAVFRKPGP